MFAGDKTKRLPVCLPASRPAKVRLIFSQLAVLDQMQGYLLTLIGIFDIMLALTC